MKKADEMEMSINFRALRISMLLVGALLIVWNIIELIVKGEINFLPFYLMLLQSGSFFFSKVILTKRLVRDNKDEE